jgi:multisubunit Na+/H+ antiporter MnhB subunit
LQRSPHGFEQNDNADVDEIAAMKRAKEASGSRIDAAIYGVIAALLLVGSGVFFWIFYERYWKWDFNYQGRYWDDASEQVFTTGGAIWVVPALVLLAIAIVFARVALRAYRSACSRHEHEGASPSDTSPMNR